MESVMPFLITLTLVVGLVLLARSVSLKGEAKRLHTDAKKLQADLERLQQGSEEKLQALENEFDRRVGELVERIPYPWCPECRCEISYVDEDGCCSTCGVDSIAPTSEHVGKLQELGAL